jgi:hypothetical protein
MVLGVCAGCAGFSDGMNELSSNPAIYDAAARSAAMERNYQRANAFQAVGDMHRWNSMKQTPPPQIIINNNGNGIPSQPKQWWED